MRLFTDVLSLFEPTVPQGRPGLIYELVLRPALGASEDLSRSPQVLAALEAGQTEDGYELEGLIHWSGGLVVRLRLPDSHELDRVVGRLKDRTTFEGGLGWEDEPSSVRLIRPEMADNPLNAFALQMDRIRQTLEPMASASVGLFYFHRALPSVAAA